MATILTRRLHTQIAHNKVLKSRTNTHLSKWQTFLSATEHGRRQKSSLTDRLTSRPK